MNDGDRRPLIAHVVFRFDIGGLENGVVNLINGLPENEFRHAVIALTEASDFRERIGRSDVAVHALGKRPGKDPAAYWRLYRLLRQLRPAIVHTRNLGTLECAAVAALAGVPYRIHGEHGWDVHDPDGKVWKYRVLRKLLNPFIHQFVTVSRDLQQWLLTQVGIAPAKVWHICNGVDTQRFRPAPAARADRGNIVVVGSVLRFEPIKDPLNLVRAFLKARRELAGRRVDLRLMVAGDGPLRAQALKLLVADRAAAAVFMPGARNDIPDFLRALDVFVLGSQREGISNTVLEAMASGLPVIATATGGNLELIAANVNGRLVPTGDSNALSQAIVAYAEDAQLRREQGRASRVRAESEYSLTRMLKDYRLLYAEAVQGAAR
ncbi:MAG TPA: TIGR03088 family PEP-CTERM/XrtA system glycosyltransferase [Steroidobacteraceae bacterium]